MGISSDGCILHLKVKYEYETFDKIRVHLTKDGCIDQTEPAVYCFDSLSIMIEERWEDEQIKKAEAERRKEILASMSEEDRKLFL